MAEKDIAEKNLIAYKDVFADIYNALVFGGKQVIQPNELKQLVTKNPLRTDDSALHEIERDTVKLWERGKIQLALLGAENQTAIDRYMALRVMGYDGVSYHSQLLSKKEERKSSVYPVITLVLYFGERRWGKYRSLLECFELDENLDETERQAMLAYMNDYKLNIIEVCYLTDEQIKLFQSDFKVVARFFVQKRKREPIVDETVIEHVDAVLKLMSVLTRDSRYESLMLDFLANKKGEPIRMCTVWDEVEARGKQRGLEEGMAKATKLCICLLHDGRVDLIEKMDAMERKKFEELLKEYGIE